MKDKSFLWWLLGVVLIAGVGYFVLSQKPAGEPVATDQPTGETATTTPATPTYEGEVTIGSLFPAGDERAYGQALERSVELAVARINAEGGVLHKKLILAPDVSSCEGVGVASATQALIETRGAIALIGGTCPKEALEMSLIARERGTVLVSPAVSVTSSATGADQTVLNLYPPTADEGKVAATYALDDFQAKTAAVVYEDADASRQKYAAFVKAFKGLGGKVVLERGYKPGTTNFQTQAGNIKTAKPDVVYLVPDSAASGLAMLQELRKEGIQVRILTTDGLLAPDLVKANADAFDGVVGFGPTFETKTDPYKAFADAYQQTYQEPVQYAYQQANAYSAVYLVKYLMEQKGVDAAGMREALGSLQGWSGGVLRNVTLVAGRELPVGAFQVLVVRQGEVQSVDTIENK